MVVTTSPSVVTVSPFAILTTTRDDHELMLACLYRRPADPDAEVVHLLQTHGLKNPSIYYRTRRPLQKASAVEGWAQCWNCPLGVACS